MNSSRSSEVALALLVLVAVAAVPAAAVSVAGDVPDSARVDEQQDVTFTFTKLYTDYDEWTLRGETELTQVTWTVTAYDNTGAKIEQRSFTGQNFSYHVQASEGTTKVTVRLQGTTPAVEDWHYQPPQTFAFATFAQAQTGGSATVIEAWDEVRPYTEQSQRARTQIQQARAAIEAAREAGASVSGANRTLQNAIEAYNSGNFDLAVDLANQAEQSAESVARSNRLKRWALLAGGALVLLALLGGGVWWYLNQRETYDKLA